MLVWGVLLPCCRIAPRTCMAGSPHGAPRGAAEVAAVGAAEHTGPEASVEELAPAVDSPR